MIYFLILKFIGANVYGVFIEYCVFFDYNKIFRTLAFLCFPRCERVYTIMAGQTPALQQNW